MRRTSQLRATSDEDDSSRRAQSDDKNAAAEDAAIGHRRFVEVLDIEPRKPSAQEANRRWDASFPTWLVSLALLGPLEWLIIAPVLGFLPAKDMSPDVIRGVLATVALFFVGAFRICSLRRPMARSAICSVTTDASHIFRVMFFMLALRQTSLPTGLYPVTYCCTMSGTSRIIADRDVFGCVSGP